jgi:hypothetical protein
MRQENKHFDIELAPVERVCKRTSHKIMKYRKWYGREFRPCLINQCGLWPYAEDPETEDPDMTGKVTHSQKVGLQL